MKIGLVGFAGSGKTTVFNAMTGLHAPVGFGGELRIGTVRVPEARIDSLSKIFSPKKPTYAEISFSDIPGEHGAERKGLSTKALARIREQDGLCLVLRDFGSPTVEGDADLFCDFEAFHMECLATRLEATKFLGRIAARQGDRAGAERAMRAFPLKDEESYMSIEYAAIAVLLGDRDRAMQRLVAASNRLPYARLHRDPTPIVCEAIHHSMRLWRSSDIARCYFRTW